MENFHHFIKILYLERSTKMLEINVHITAPELVEAVHDLAKMLAGKPASKFEQSPPQVQDKGPELLSGTHMAPPQHPVPTQVTPPANTPRPVPAPPMPTSMPAQPPTPPVAPPVAPATPVPTTSPQYDYPTLFNAAAALMGAGGKVLNYSNFSPNTGSSVCLICPQISTAPMLRTYGDWGRRFNAHP